MVQEILPPIEGIIGAEIPLAAQRIDVRADIGRHALTNELVHGVAISQYVDGTQGQPGVRVVSTYLPDIARNIANSILEICDGLDAARLAQAGVEQQGSEIEHVEPEGNA